jgi:hypothetical protein
MSVRFTEVEFTNKNSIEVDVMVEAPIGTPVGGGAYKVPGNKTLPLVLGVYDVQSILLDVKDEGHPEGYKQSFAVAAPTKGRPCYLESAAVEYTIGSFTGTVKART